MLGLLDEDSWGLATPAAGWAVRDQVSHLAFFDDAATMAIVDPDAFVPMAEAGTGHDGSRGAAVVAPRSARQCAGGGLARCPRPGPVVRPPHGGALVRVGAAHGDLGARPRHRRRAGRHPHPHVPPAPHRPSRRAGPAVLL